MSQVSGKAFDGKILKRILGYVKPYKGIFATAISFTIVLSIMAAVRPLLIMYTIDNYIITPENAEEMRELSSALLLITIVMIGTLVLESIMQFTNQYLTSLIGQRIVRDLRVQLHGKILGFKSKYFDKTPIGTLVTRVVSDIEAINDVFSQGFIVIAGDLLLIIVYLVVMLYVNWSLTLVVLTTIPVMFFATWVFKNAVKQSFTDVRNQVSRLNAFVQEHITGMKIVQVFSREEEELNRFREINKKHRDANIKSVWYYSVFFPVVEILVSVSLGLLVWYAGSQIVNIEATPGQVAFFVILINQFFRPIRMLADRVNTLQMGMVASERVFKILDEEEAIENNGILKADSINGNIRFRDTWFAYNNEDWVLKGINFDVAAGESIALVGATGSGKTSIINLLGRFYEFNKGDISIDGVSIRDYELSSLRKNIGVVLQDVFLFSGSIYSNITLDNPAITREQVIAAAKAVGAHEFIMQLPGGYDFDVRERGGMLSVGQRQLISFIRVYVYNPRVLVLDEATSSIDTESEILIQRATEILTKGRTSVIIAHRLATIRKASKIFVIDKGTIAESGSHDELLMKGGAYARLYEIQFKEESAA